MASRRSILLACHVRVRAFTCVTSRMDHNLMCYVSDMGKFTDPGKNSISSRWAIESIHVMFNKLSTCLLVQQEMLESLLNGTVNFELWIKPQRFQVSQLPSNVPVKKLALRVISSHCCQRQLSHHHQSRSLEILCRKRSGSDSWC